MLYELRTRFLLPGPETELGRADRYLEWLSETLPVTATLGADVAPPKWLGNRYTEPTVTFELVTHYRNIFAATADRLRIARAWGGRPEPFQADFTIAFEVLRVYGETELLNIADPTKKMTHPL
ncbi:MAG: hypothetical protein QOF58_6878 [Pseudonocardiales bacterium]|jgi:hypothetical protein|nr:hypothetical protein [Pseudonocardiales bacterium]